MTSSSAAGKSRKKKPSPKTDRKVDKLKEEVKAAKQKAAKQAAALAAAEKLVEKLKGEREAFKSALSPYRLAIENMRQAGYTEEEIESITLGHKALRYQFVPPVQYRALRKALREGVQPEDITDNGEQAYREVAIADGITEREAYGWMLGYPPDFGIVT